MIVFILLQIVISFNKSNLINLYYDKLLETGSS